MAQIYSYISERRAFWLTPYNNGDIDKLSISLIFCINCQFKAFSNGRRLPSYSLIVVNSLCLLCVINFQARIGFRWVNSNCEEIEEKIIWKIKVFVHNDVNDARRSGQATVWYTLCPKTWNESMEKDLEDFFLGGGRWKNLRKVIIALT